MGILGHDIVRNRGSPPWPRAQVVGRVFDDLPGLERLEAVTDVVNVRSQRVLEKVGFHREGCCAGTSPDAAAAGPEMR